MNKLYPLAAAVATVFSMAPVQARTMPAHERLVDALKRTGISIHLNSKNCISATFSGYYHSSSGRMVICQDNGVDGSGNQAPWTANDLDTLRHEAHHVAQDCIATGIGDNSLGTVYVKPFAFAQQYFGTIVINNIMNNYKKLGAPEHVQVLEVEAFAVAQMNNPDQQVTDLRKYCL